MALLVYLLNNGHISICKLAIIILHNFTSNEILCKHNGIPLGAHFTYWNSVTYWPENGLR